MNILFLSISSLPPMHEHSISLDLLRTFVKNGHRVYAVCALEKREHGETNVSKESGVTVLRVRIGNNKKAGLIEKGITTVMLPQLYKAAVKRYFGDVKFDLVLYPTPPVTQVDTVRFIKKRDGAKSYLLLKDIFPQNAVDIGMMSKSGVKGILWRYFRGKEKKLYAVSDHIGCMSDANAAYLKKHDPEIPLEKIEVCPNTAEFADLTVDGARREQVRTKYGLPTDRTVFVYGGNLGKPQDIPFVIECLKKEERRGDVFFLIVGDGTEYTRLENYINGEKPSNVKLIKRLPKEEYDALVAACDVGLIFLDHRFTIPNFPSRLLGYLQAGLPVLACTDPNTDIGSVIENGGFGWQCESSDPALFSETVTRAAAECHDAAMKENALKCLKTQFNVERSYETIMAHFGKE